MAQRPALSLFPNAPSTSSNLLSGLVSNNGEFGTITTAINSKNQSIKNSPVVCLSSSTISEEQESKTTSSRLCHSIDQVKKPPRVRHAKVSNKDFSRFCVVCGDRAYNYNYGCICCESCKMFFRRNSWKIKSLTCVQRKPGDCDLSVLNRRNCPACRLQKCLDCGMIRELNSYERTFQESMDAYSDSSSSRSSQPLSSMIGVDHLGEFLINKFLSPKPMGSVIEVNFTDKKFPAPEPICMAKPFQFKCCTNFESFRKNQTNSQNSILNKFLHKINQEFLLEESMQKSNKILIKQPPKLRYRQETNSLRYIPLDEYLLTSDELIEVNELGENYHFLLGRPNYPNWMAQYLTHPQFHKLLTAADVATKRLVFFGKTLRKMNEMRPEHQKLLMATRFAMLSGVRSMSSFDPQTFLYRYPLENGTSISVNLSEIFARVFINFPDVTLISEILAEYSRIIGQSHSGMALLLAMKFFEVHFIHESALDGEYIAACKEAFQHYARLLFKFIWLHYGPEVINSKWKYFCDILQFSQERFDKAIISVVLHATEEPPESDVLQDLSNDMMRLHVNVNSNQ